MDRWTFYYGNVALMSGLSTSAKDQLADAILNAVSEDKPVWFIGGPETGMMQFLIHPAAQFAFLSQTASASDLYTADNMDIRNK